MDLKPILLHAQSLCQRGHWQQAEQLLQTVSNPPPVDPEFWYLMAGIMGWRGDYAAAEAHCRRALLLKPDYGLAYFRLGNALDALARRPEALDAYDYALRLLPEYEHLWNNKGVSLMALARPKEAEHCFRKALTFQPSIASFEVNLGLALAAQGFMREAITHFEQACRLDPEEAEAHWSLANAWLALGEYTQGWPYYDWRWRRRNKQRRQYLAPLWQGQQVHQQRVFVYPEQGQGDAIQFIRFVALLKNRGAITWVQCDPSLLALFKTAEGIDTLSVDEPREFDFHLPIADLPKYFVKSDQDIPQAGGYIEVPSGDYTALKRRLVLGEPRRRIGLVWAGNPKHANDFNRSCPLEALRPLFAHSSAQFYSLQKEPVTHEDQSLLQRAGVISLGDLLENFAQTAFALKQLDLLISVDTSVAHLAGALAVPCWLMLPLAPDWRWQLESRDTPWYESLVLYRPPQIGDWSANVAAINSDLMRFLGAV